MINLTVYKLTNINTTILANNTMVLLAMRLVDCVLSTLLLVFISFLI